MPRNSKSQWDFGELFPPEQIRRVLTVAELTGSVRRLLEQQIGSVWVTGEVTNLRAQSSGHIYFSLKDASAQLSCVLFRSEGVSHRAQMQDGLKVVLQGEMTVYEARGQYQLIVRAVELQGVGALQLAFERLKQKLAAEGLFAEERKRPLPEYPQRIGLVTSPTGAAIRDVLHVVQRRQPGLEIIFAPCRVQGQGAAEEIAAAIALLNEFSTAGEVRGAEEKRGKGDMARSSPFPPFSFSPLPRSARKLDLILVTRGGGSLEDLWAFNEEVVARAIAASAIPVVSAVGHEIDFTISDFVADVRAATPSAAAEIITEGAFASRAFVAEAFQRMRQLARSRVAMEREDGESLIGRLARAHPRRRLNEQLQHLDDLISALVRGARAGWRQQREHWQHLRQRLTVARPAAALAQRRQTVGELAWRLHELVRHAMENQRHQATSLDARLRLLSPENVLSRGYSITLDAQSGKVIRDVKTVRAGQKLRTKLKTGEVMSKVESGQSGETGSKKAE